NFNIIRIPLSHGSLSLSDHSDNILSYTVRIYPTAYPERVWKRTFVLQEKPYFQHVFFLQNKLGVLESFFATVESREKTVEGEVVRKNGGNEIDITDNSTVFTVSTGCKSTHELELLEAAVGNPFNYKIVDGKAVPISILPDTFTIHDEAEETQSVQFQYMFNIEASDSGERSGIGRAIITTVHDYFETTWADERSAAVGGIGGVPEIWIDGERFNKIAVKTSLAKTEFNRI
ncbi:hypothetical protein LJC68_09555, partial [Bacteroidales bacterium OttesenSCG-928-B11]|nr:hypothetical protein [Bacteroidales bacterium OttesenSCG-928-B11]